MSRRLILAVPAVAIAAAGLLTDGQLAAQAVDGALQSFEVASIRPVNLEDSYVDYKFLPNRFIATALSLSQLIEQAYGLTAREIRGGPDWVRRDLFEVIGTTSEEVDRPRMQLMLRQLLADRFQLQIEREDRSGTMYTLVTRNVHGLKRPARSDVPPAVFLHREAGALSSAFEGRNATMALFIERLSHQLRTPIVDQTNLTGNYDFRIAYANDAAFTRAQGDADVPTLFSALESQLGLKLVAGTAPIASYVIRRAAKPSANQTHSPDSRSSERTSSRSSLASPRQSDCPMDSPGALAGPVDSDW